MKFGVVVFPGSNCDADMYHALRDAMGLETEYIWHQERNLSGFDVIALPGGFTYGDYLRTGAVARFSPVMEAVTEFANAGGLVFGVCNGFQILLEAGLLPGAMMRNRSQHFRCAHQFIRVEQANSPFTCASQAGQVIDVPIAHGEGNYYCDAETLARLEGEGQILFRYCDQDGNITDEANPNGSLANIAGIRNDKGNVMGMMPHPERCADPLLGWADGRLVFESIIKTMNSKLSV